MTLNNRIMERRLFNKLMLSSLASATPIDAFAGILYPRYFSFAWEEEVQLQSGLVILVSRETVYERIGSSLDRYGGTILQRDTILSMDFGSGHGVVKQLFKGLRPIFLDHSDGAWLLVMHGGYYENSQMVAGQDWGKKEGPYGQWAIKLLNGKWAPISMTRLPTQFQKPNMMILYGDVEEHARFNGTTVSLKQKEEWLKLHPRSPPDRRLVRSREQSNRPDWMPCNLTC